MLAFQRFLGCCHNGRGAQVVRGSISQPPVQTIAGLKNEHSTTCPGWFIKEFGGGNLPWILTKDGIKLLINIILQTQRISNFFHT